MSFFRLKTFFLLIAFMCAGIAHAQDKPAGIIASIQPDVYAVRGEEQVQLELRSPIFKSDVLITGENGRAQVLFADDTIITLAPDTELYMEDFDFGTDTYAPNFAMEISKGVARVITGQIVKQNREGFNVSTPHATIGIRGTVITVLVQGSDTSVFMNQVDPSRPVEVMNLQSLVQSTINEANVVVSVNGSTNDVRSATAAELTMLQTILSENTLAPATSAEGTGTTENTIENTPEDSAQNPETETPSAPGTIRPSTPPVDLPSGSVVADPEPSTEVPNADDPALVVTPVNPPETAGPDLPGVDVPVIADPQRPGLPEFPDIQQPEYTNARYYSGDLSNAGNLGVIDAEGSFSFDLNLTTNTASNGTLDMTYRTSADSASLQADKGKGTYTPSMSSSGSGNIDIDFLQDNIRDSLNGAVFGNEGLSLEGGINNNAFTGQVISNEHELPIANASGRAE